MMLPEENELRNEIKSKNIDILDRNVKK